MPDYAFYTDEYLGGSIPENQIRRLAKRAQEQLAWYKRIYRVTAPDDRAEAFAICAMADAMYFYECAQNGETAVSSASIGSVSVSYGNAGKVDLSSKAQEAELYSCACRYLDIYRGV